MKVILVRKYEPYPDLSRCLLHRYNPLMKRTHKILPPEQTAAELAHFVWCALIALRTAQRDGQALVPLTIHTFLPVRKSSAGSPGQSRLSLTDCSAWDGRKDPLRALNNDWNTC
ncbi:hypothetical protein AAIG28_23235 [Citrobacter freundii]|nr:hypothetical protein [Citrobacter freundii]